MIRQLGLAMREDRLTLAADFGGELETGVSREARDAPQFYLTAPSACPYLPGQQERKIFTHLVGKRAARSERPLDPDRIPPLADDRLSARLRELPGLRVGPRAGGPFPSVREPAPRDAERTPTLSAPLSRRNRPTSTTSSSAPISTPGIPRAAWPTCRRSISP